MKQVLATLCMSLLLTGSLHAATAEKKSGETKPKSAKSIECSKQADAKGLHGKDRKIFREKCKKGES
jgi:hypothetical protein